MNEFCRAAREKHKYSEEQALGMLIWHKHDVEKAYLELSNFAPFPDDWATEDKILFEQAFSYHGKSFHRIKEMVGGIARLYERRGQRLLTRHDL